MHETLRNIRKSKGYTCEEMASLLGIKKSAYAKKERGEVQFTETALSGICMFDLAGKIDMRRLEDFRIQLDLLPDKKEEDALSMLYTLQGTRFSRSSEEMMTGLLQRPLARLVLKNAHIRADQPCSELNDNQLRGIARELKHLRFPVTGTADFSQAQATAGGVRGDALDDFLMVKAHPGLYVTGEAVDVQSICGGYHLHWCWASGCRAAAHLAGGIL